MDIHFVNSYQYRAGTSRGVSEKKQSKAKKYKPETDDAEGEGLDVMKKLKDSENPGFETLSVFSSLLDKVDLNMNMDFHSPLNLTRIYSLASDFQKSDFTPKNVPSKIVDDNLSHSTSNQLILRIKFLALNSHFRFVESKSHINVTS